MRTNSATSLLQQIAFGLAVLLAGAHGFGQTQIPGLDAETPPAVKSAPTPKERITAGQAEIKLELERLEAQVAAGGDPPSATHVREREMLMRIELLLQQELVVLKQKDEATVTLEEVKADLAGLQSPGLSPGPYSVILLDTVRDELTTLRNRLDTSKAAVAAASQARELARKTHDEREVARRRAREASEQSSNGTQQGALARQLHLARIESRVSAEELYLRQLESEYQQLLQETLTTRIAVAEQRERAIAADTVFAANDLRGKIVELEAQGEELRRQLDLEGRELGFGEREWLDAKRRLEASTGDETALVEEVAARRLAFQVHQRRMSILTKRIERLTDRSEMWQRRAKLWRAPPDRATMKTWNTETRALLERLETEGSLQTLEIRDLMKEAATLQERLADAEVSVAPWIKEQIDLTTRLGAAYDTNVASINAVQRVAERVLGDIGSEMATVEWGERIEGLWTSVQAVWQFELATVEDRPITVGKIVFGLLLLIVGFFGARVVSTWLGRRALPRFGLDEGAAAAIRSVVFYVLLVCIVFIALRMLNIPLTAFTILGGAAAIGIGFGSQNIMNNFMSGLIMIAERPVRVGDLIQLGDLHGVVQHIGARSTRVLAGNNIEIVVPNSSFLENNVINWTLSETKVRINVSVGVAYGSPTRDVTRLLLRAVQEHGRVLKSPNAIVLFTEFGDNALHFEVLFWIVMRRMMDRNVIESDIRYRIDSLFNEAGIVIAFPQRDVHVNSLRPLEIRVVQDAATAATAEPATAGTLDV